MESKDIIKALECSISDCFDKCKKCFYAECDSDKGCIAELCEDALNLIKNQQAEIEELKDILDKKVIEFAYEKKQEIKIEAYKEFADMLKKEFSQCQREYRNALNSDGACAMIIAKKVVDNILTELTERKEDGKNG